MLDKEREGAVESEYQRRARAQSQARALLDSARKLREAFEEHRARLERGPTSVLARFADAQRAVDTEVERATANYIANL